MLGNFSLSIAIYVMCIQLDCIYCIYTGQIGPNFIISNLWILKRLPVYDKVVSKLTYFVNLVLKFIESCLLKRIFRDDIVVTST